MSCARYDLALTSLTEGAGPDLPTCASVPTLSGFLPTNLAGLLPNHLGLLPNLAGLLPNLPGLPTNPPTYYPTSLMRSGAWGGEARRLRFRRLTYTLPENPHHPDQAYRTRKQEGTN